MLAELLRRSRGCRYAPGPANLFLLVQTIRRMFSDRHSPIFCIVIARVIREALLTQANKVSALLHGEESILREYEFS